MDKAELSLKTLVEIIFFGFLTLLIALPLIAKFVGFFVDAPDEGTKKSLDTLVLEINNLDGEMTVPVFVDEGHLIAGYKIKGLKPPDDDCEEDSACLCVCSFDNPCTQQDRKMICKKLEFDLAKDIEILPKLVNKKGEVVDEDGDAKIQSCILKKEDKLVTISCS